MSNYRSRMYLRATIGVCVVGLAALSSWAADPNPPSITSTRGAWKITRQWTPAETRHYAKWIEHLYTSKVNGDAEQRMAKIEYILKDPRMNLLLDPDFLGKGSNPQLPDSVMRMAHSVLDCAKLTAFLPAYYAYRRGLPWMFTYVASGGGDIRTADANIPTATRSNFDTGSLSAFFADMLQSYSSGNYRVELNGRGSQISDSVPAAITPETLLPGCPMYTDGHCLLLAKVTPYGELYFLNASTTNTRDIYTYNGMNVVSGITPKGSQDPGNPWAGCFQGLRVWRYPIAETNSKGQVVNVRRRTDEEMKEFGFSTEQYELINQIIDQKYIQVGDFRPTSLHDFIRLRMRSVDQINPLQFLEQYADELVTMFELREDFVQDAWRDYRQNGPIVYPENLPDSNIFQAHGRWETWSSPSSDVDRRNKYFYLIDWLNYAIRWYGMAPEMVDLTGLEKYTIRSQYDLMQALVSEKKRIFDEHYIYYTNSKGQKVKLTLTDIEERLYDLSFDPNHPPELRWGAPAGSVERASAPQTYTPVPSGARVPMEEAYRLQTYFRTVGERETDPSQLRTMFVSGFGIREKLEPYLTYMWSHRREPTPELIAYFEARGIPIEKPGETTAAAPRTVDATVELVKPASAEVEQTRVRTRGPRRAQEADASPSVFSPPRPRRY